MHNSVKGAGCPSLKERELWAGLQETLVLNRSLFLKSVLLATSTISVVPIVQRPNTFTERGVHTS